MHLFLLERGVTMAQALVLLETLATRGYTGTADACTYQAAIRPRAVCIDDIKHTIASGQK